MTRTYEEMIFIILESFFIDKDTRQLQNRIHLNPEYKVHEPLMSEQEIISFSWLAECLEYKMMNKKQNRETYPKEN